MYEQQDHLARAGTNPEIVAQVAALIADRWDPAADLTAPDGTQLPSGHASALLAVLAAGGSLAEVVGYMRRAEEERFDVPRSTAADRFSLAEVIRALAFGSAPK